MPQSLVRIGSPREKVLNKQSDKAWERFTVSCKPRVKAILTNVIAERNLRSGIQINQSDLVQEILEDWLITRGYLRRDKESYQEP